MRIEPIVLRTLGTAQVDIGPVQVRPNAVRRFAALLYLSAEAGRRVPRRCLIDLLFPEQTERNGLHSLRELVYQLKSAGVGLEVDQDGVELPATAVRADYAAMLGSDRLTIEQIRAAQGGFLPGYAPHGSEAFKEWFEPFRAKTVFGLSQVLLREHGRALEVANLEASEFAARSCLAVAPLNERAIKALAQTLALGGAKADAVTLLTNYAAEVGSRSPELEISAQLFKHRLMERLPDHYRHGTELPFGGRDDEMLELRRRLSASSRGSAQCVLVLGEPGIGKTRLISEFGALAQFEGTHLAKFNADSNDQRRPMSVFTDLVPNLLQIPGAIGIEPASMQALTLLTRRGTPASDPELRDPQAVSHAITCALDDLISAITAETHLTIAIEDAHWVDALSLRALAGMMQRRNRRLLIVLSSRERELNDFVVPFDNFACIQLEPLEQGVAIDITRRALKSTGGESHVALHRWVAEAANGHPLFIASLIAHFVATGEPFVVPASLQDLMRKRVDRLDDSSALVLRTCVLLGSLSTLPRVVACLQLPYAEIVLAIAQLEAAHTVKWVDGKLIAAHALLAEVLLQRTTDVVKALLHIRIASTLEAELSTADSLAVLWSCAEHWIAAGDHQRAFKLLHKCADHARGIGRLGPAAQILMRGATMQVDQVARVEALRKAVALAKAAQEHDLALQGIAQLRQIDPGARYVDIEIAELHIMSVTHRDCAGYEERVLAFLGAAANQPEHKVRAGLAALQYADTNGLSELALRVSSAVSESDLGAVDLALALQYRLVYEASFGDPSQGAVIARRLQNLASDMPGANGLGFRFNAMVGLLRAGAVDEAFQACRQVYELAKACGAVKPQISAALQIALFLADKGRLDETIPWRRRALSLVDDNLQHVEGFETYVHEVDFCLIEGDPVRAQQILLRCEELGFFTSPMRQRWHRGLRARLTQVSGERPLADEELQGLIREGDDSTPVTGVRDLEVAVICTALCQKQDQMAAQQVLHDFLAARRRLDGVPIAPHLKHVIRTCGLNAGLDRLEVPAR